MALEITTRLNIDFYDKKYILINAKQYDDVSRFIYLTCYDNGSIFNISSSKYNAYVRYRKADGHGVLNTCRISNIGEVIVELTEQMLASDGICYVDLIIVNKGSAIVNIDTGEIITIDNSPILSTMAFCINVYEASFDNSIVESSDEFDALNDLLKKANAEYKEVIQLSKSYAIGDAGNIRENENFDNSKYYCEQSRISAENAKQSEEAAKQSEINALASEQNAKASEQNAKSSEEAAKQSETNALASEQNAKASEEAALLSEQNAKASEEVASLSETNSKNSENAALLSEQNAKASEEAASSSEKLSKSYAVGGTGIRDGEDTDNSRYYYEMSKTIVENMTGGFVPMGSIFFSELASAEKATGYTYNIKDDFITDDTFKEGSGKSYTAGTNVYCAADGYWDCLGGSTYPVATVDEVKTYLSI